MENTQAKERNENERKRVSLSQSNMNQKMNGCEWARKTLFSCFLPHVQRRHAL